MAYDRYDLKYHLTPSGWVTQNDPPDDCVETWDMHAEQASGWSRERKAWSCAWASPKWTREQRDEMRKQHPIPDENLRRDRNFVILIGDPL